jgi:hypothetical protein
MVAVPTPYDATSGTKLTAGDWDLGVRDPLLFLMTAYPRVHAWSSTNLSFSDATTTLVTFNSENYDTDGMHSTSSNTSRITAVTAGLYEFRWFVRMASATYTQLDLDLRLNANGASGGGSSILPSNLPFTSGGSFRLINFSYCQFMNAGDYHEAFVTQTSGATRVATGGPFTTFCQARWIATS